MSSTNGKPRSGKLSPPRRLALSTGTGVLRIVASLVVPAITFFALRWSFIFMRDADANKILIAVVALVFGVGAVWALYLLTDNLVGLLPERARRLIRPFVFVGPAMAILGIYLLYPTVQTLIQSFMGARGTEFVGLDNFAFVFTSPEMLIALRNNLLWLVLVTGFVVSLGLIVAVMVDRIGRWEPVAKSIIFLPMAISAVGAGVIWKFIYSFQAIQRPQIGLLNAILVALGGQPQGWLILKPWNNFFLIAIMIWILTGFAMVVLSAAVKSVPASLMEAARIDGASEIRIFFRIIIPYISGTLITISTTVIIMVLKVFDIVYVMTNGQNNTEVIANRMYRELFTYRNQGHASAIAIVLLIAVTPVMIYNIRSMRKGGVR
jgi:alpha-glucoside transport system permease protein